MSPRMNPRDIQKAMKRMGIKQQEVNANRVIIRCDDKNIIIDDPEVVKINMMGQENFQVSGKVHEESLDETPEINSDDIETVMNQAGVEEKIAKDALLKNNGDIAKTILELRK